MKPHEPTNQEADSTEESGGPKSMEDMSMEERAKILNRGSVARTPSDADADRVQRLNRDPKRPW